MGRESTAQSAEVGVAEEMPAEAPKSGAKGEAAGKGWTSWLRRGRPETMLLLMAAGCTLIAKLIAVRDYQPASLLASWVSVTLSDVVFFAGVGAVIGYAYALRPSKTVARITSVVALLILLWSVANAAWLVVTGVQLHFGVVLVVLRHPTEFWPTVRPYVLKIPALSIVVGLGTLGALWWVVWRVVRPVPIVRNWRRFARWATVGVAVMIAAAVIQPHMPYVGIGSVGQVLSFSSHWYALVSGFAERSAPGEAEEQTRHVPRAGERLVRLPDSDPAELPNVVVVLLESASYPGSGIGDPERTLMPTFERLRDEGVEFVNTHVPVARTGKAFWSVLSGMTPDVYHDYSEAVLVDQPYEGLPSLLGRIGYRSAFFEMSRGTFECAPGTFANFAFDWAWFQENLEDPSACLSLLSADDFRMLDPMFDWAGQNDQPFLLMMITSVSHDPCIVPSWFGVPAEDPRERYEQTLRYTDTFLAELCRRLDGLSSGRATLLCVLGDHGESLRPDVRHSRWVPYEEVLRIPWIIRWPGHVEAGRRCEWPSSQLDVTPTLLSLLGYDIADAGFEGRDAMTPSDPDRRLYFSTWFADSPLGYRVGQRKWLYWPRNEKVFEYDLAADPNELAPTPVEGPAAERIVKDVLHWKQSSYIEFDPKRFRKRLVFDHWWTFSSGRYGRAYYVP